MKVLQAQVHRGGRVHVTAQTAAGERIQVRVEDAAFTDGVLDALLAAVERAVRHAQPEPGREAIHGRPPVSGA